MIVYFGHPCYARKSEALADSLRRRGFPIEVRSGMAFLTRALLKSSPDLWIGFWYGVSFEFLPTDYIVWNAEPLDRPRERTGVNADWFTAMQNAREVWDYKNSNATSVKDLGGPIHFVPFGYSPCYESTFRRYVQRENRRQDIDVLFFGSMCERRQRILDELRRQGANVHIASERNPAYGEKLDALLARTKIVLGIHYYEEPLAQIADLARVDYVLSNGLFMVHEKPSASAPFPAFEQHVTTCGYRDIPATCLYFLARPEERASKAATAYEWFKSEYSLDAFIPYDSVLTLLG